MKMKLLFLFIFVTIEIFSMDEYNAYIWNRKMYLQIMEKPTQVHGLNGGFTN